MARTDAVSAVTGEIFREGWSKVRGSTQGIGSKRSQMVRAAGGHRAAVFKAIRGGGTHTKAQLVRQLEYLTTKSSHVVDSRGALDGKATLTAREIKGVADDYAKRWHENFNPKLGHTTHMLMSYPIGTKGEDVRDITAAVADRFFTGEKGNFDYLIAVHEDREHPHAHIVLNRRSQEGEIFYLGRDHRFNYDDFRTAMVEEAEKVGVRLEATRRVDRGVLTYPARTGEIYAAKDEGRAPVERQRVGQDLARAAAEISNASRIYGALSVEASEEGREDIANALFKAGELLAQHGRLEPTGDIYMATERFDDLRGQFAEQTARVEAMVRGLPEDKRPAAEARVNEIYAKMSHMQPLGVRSSTLMQAPSEGGVYSQGNINSALTERMREPETRAQIETALRGTGISSETVIGRVERGADNAAMEREWLSQDLEKIAASAGLNLDRHGDMRVAAGKLDDVHVRLGTALERAEVLLSDGVVEDTQTASFHYDERGIEDASRAVRQELRGQGLSEEQIGERTATGEIEVRAEARIEGEQADYLRQHPEIIASPRDVFDGSDEYGGVVTDQATADRIDREIDRIMERADTDATLDDAVAADFRQRYPDMPDHLARGLGQTYATSYEINNRDELLDAEARAASDGDYQDRASTEMREDRGIASAESQDIARAEATAERDGTPAIDTVVARERADPIRDSMPDDASRAAFRGEVERELSGEQLERLRGGDADALDQVMDDHLDRLYAAKAYLQSDEATANSEAVREVVNEIGDEEVEAQRLKHAQGHTEKGTTHG